MRIKANSKPAIIRFFLGMTLLFGMAIYLMISDSADKATWFVLALGAIPVAGAGLRILQNTRTKQE